jgi:nitrate reductase gamma subunit
VLIGLTILLDSPAVQAAHPRDRPAAATSSFWCCCTSQLMLGLSSIFVSSGHMDGAQMIKLGEWAQHIVTFRGRRRGRTSPMRTGSSRPMCSWA